jgi:hypothetical protein
MGLGHAKKKNKNKKKKKEKKIYFIFVYVSLLLNGWGYIQAEMRPRRIAAEDIKN